MKIWIYKADTRRGHHSPCEGARKSISGRRRMETPSQGRGPAQAGVYLQRLRAASREPGRGAGGRELRPSIGGPGPPAGEQTARRVGPPARAARREGGAGVAGPGRLLGAVPAQRRGGRRPASCPQGAAEPPPTPPHRPLPDASPAAPVGPQLPSPHARPSLGPSSRLLCVLGFSAAAADGGNAEPGGAADEHTGLRPQGLPGLSPPTPCTLCSDCTLLGASDAHTAPRSPPTPLTDSPWGPTLSTLGPRPRFRSAPPRSCRPDVSFVGALTQGTFPENLRRCARSHSLRCRSGRLTSWVWLWRARLWGGGPLGDREGTQGGAT